MADEEEEEEKLQKSRSPVAALKKILLSPIHLLCKRKEVDLLPGSVIRVPVNDCNMRSSTSIYKHTNSTHN